jgi:2-phosphoglycerate kinase
MSDNGDWPRAWSILLIGGSSGAGKTVAAARIARDLGIPHLHGDDFRLVLTRATGAAAHPDLHFFTGSHEVWRLPPERLAQGLADVARAMSDALAAVIAHHLDVRAPIVLEGDMLLPSLAARTVFEGIPAEGQVRGVFVHEPNEAALNTAMFARERGVERARPEEQRTQSRMAWLYGNWLRAEAERIGVTVVAARPFGTLPARSLGTVADSV